MSRHGSADSNSTEVSFKYKSTPISDVLGARRTFVGLGSLEWAFLLVSTLNILISIGVTISNIVRYSTQSASADFTFSLLLLINTVFCLFYVYNGVIREITFEVVAFAASVTIVLFYCIFEYMYNKDGRTHTKLIRLVGGCVLAPLNLYLAFKVAWRFGWLEFNIVGASEALQKMYRQQRAFYTLQKFDLQAAVSFFIITLEHGVAIIWQETIVLSLGLVVSFIWMIVTRFAVYKEKRVLVWITGVFGFIEPLFIVAKVANTYDRQLRQQDHIEDLIFYPLLVVGATAFLVRAVLFIELTIVYKNFKNGLGDHDRLITTESINSDNSLPSVNRY